ncbi:ACT domain-containing protein [Natronospora cellulosivora (SeqCode)]
MLVKQISIFLENKSGRLAEVTNILGDSGIDLIAISISDTTDFGILRIIVNKPELAEDILKEKKLTVNCTNVIAISVKDVPGGLAKALTILSKECIGVEYMYAVGKETTDAVVILRVDELEKSIEVLMSNNIKVLKAKDVYKI